jgi:hypothetical protein
LGGVVWGAFFSLFVFFFGLVFFSPSSFSGVGGLLGWFGWLMMGGSQLVVLSLGSEVWRGVGGDFGLVWDDVTPLGTQYCSGWCRFGNCSVQIENCEWRLMVMESSC